VAGALIRRRVFVTAPTFRGGRFRAAQAASIRTLPNWRADDMLAGARRIARPRERSDFPAVERTTRACARGIAPAPIRC
jgi:hypothetical protein